jgi:hypothetical protein
MNSGFLDGDKRRLVVQPFNWAHRAVNGFHATFDGQHTHIINEETAGHCVLTAIDKDFDH